MHDAAQSFLDRTGWSQSQISPIAGDLSARRYSRVSKGGKTAVLMDTSALPDSVAPFVQMTKWLRELGLSAPEVLAQDRNDSLLLIEDLGETSVGALLADTGGDHPALDTAIAALLIVRNATPPALPRPNAKELCDWTRLADAHYPGACSASLNRIRTELEIHLAPLCQEGATVSLRDFHADNLMWLEGRSGVARLGLLDYQDAMLAHPVYDLVSLLTDARTEISPEVRGRCIGDYAAASGDDPVSLAQAFSVFSIQRNLRILGIFYRAADIDGKSHHLPKVPRVYRYLKEAFAHPALSHLQDDFSKALPGPGELS